MKVRAVLRIFPDRTSYADEPSFYRQINGKINLLIYLVHKKDYA